MDTEKIQYSAAGSNVFQRRSQTLDELCARLAHRFRRPAARERVRRYLASLLSNIKRKNGWQMCPKHGRGRCPHGTQRILNGARWDFRIPYVMSCVVITSQSISGTKIVAS